MVRAIVTFIIILTTTILGGERFSLVGLSGKSYSLPMVDSKVVIDSVFKTIYIGFKSSDSLYTVKSGGKKHFLRIKDSILIYNNIDTIANVKRTKKGLLLPPTSASKLLTDITNLNFTYNGNKLTISKKEKHIDSVTGIVVIDPGHGGKDPGAIGADSVFEKDVVLAIALKCRDYLETNSKIKVFLTRDSDVFIPLHDRTIFANDKKADLFVSIHANSSPKNDDVGGYKMYFLSDAKSETDDHFAKIENSAMRFENSGANTDILQSVLLDMINNEFLKESQDLSVSIYSKFKKNIKDISPLHTGVGQANFYVLNGAAMPAVLVETCFISNSKEEELLSSEKFQESVAKAIGDGIIEFRKKQAGVK